MTSPDVDAMLKAQTELEPVLEGDMPQLRVLRAAVAG